MGRRKSSIATLATGAAVLGLAACGGGGPIVSTPQVGPMPPALPAPHSSLIPTVKIAPASGWREGAKPVAGPGMAVGFFASGLNHPRWLYVLPNTDVLVAESNAPAKPTEGIRGWVMAQVMKRAGAGVPSPDRITLLRDNDADGVAETKSVFLEGVKSPFGMALVKGSLYVATADAIVAYPYRNGQTRITGPGVKLTDLPGGPINHHWTKNILASRDGTRLYATVGSNSNVGENGLAAEEGRAAIWEVTIATGAKRLFATGLRNPNGMDIDRERGVLWTVVNERDELGNDLVPDYLTSVVDGGFYGWPYSYWGQHVDRRVKPQRPDLVAAARTPDYALGSHVAPLGLAINRGDLFGPAFKDGAFIGEHGSWNRSPRSGYKVVFVPFAQGRPSGPPQDVLTGFLDANGKAQGRPVGVAMDRAGALLVADDVGNMVWRVTSTAPPAAEP